jgi:uncharacterized protein YndB with AHSA1/START domain
MSVDIRHFKPSIVYAIYIASTPEKVWQAITSAEFSKQFFFGNSVEIEPRVGGKFKLRRPDGSLDVTGEVVECDPPRKLVITWGVNWTDLVKYLGISLVTFEIAQAGEAVRLTLTQSQDRELDERILSGGRRGWPAILSSLKSLLETGKGLHVKMEPPKEMLEAIEELKRKKG